ncbi:cyclic peptide export ABC transporter [Chondromyces apiculatus]|uniref:ABC-type siderophore export system, fused ATPase and permease components n=1 Tax=Chondromyces apiculatus DSM 436 TaxID=1192034 RepID=A0A017THG7_9BACT|nr:cyclic peptide export ABC transporter [Chondromyces apiculatus]EYF08723.1 ABC-type siderophore export system, fused ATPase and permease components [Chondromyces apiculatus DSM 436]
MGLIQQINLEAGESRRRILLANFLTGAAHTGIMVCVNEAIENQKASVGQLFFLFLVLILLFVVGYRYTARQVTITFENLLYKIKVRVTDKLRRMELQGLEQIGTAEIYDRITENMTVVSELSGTVAIFLRSVFMVSFGALYMIYLSPNVFILEVFLFAVFISLFLSARKTVKGYMRDAAHQRLAFFEVLTDLIQGFKEVKFSRRRSDDLQVATEQAANTVRESTLKANLLLEDSLLAPTLNSFAMLGLIAFIVPIYMPTEPETLASLVALGMFIFHPITGVVGNVQYFMRAELALENIEKLERKLEESTHDQRSAADPWHGRFGAIEARDIAFRYVAQGSDEAFHVGPVSLTVAAGEILFIVGGNGSGKSTLLKVLTGLYPPASGSLLVDGICVGEKNVQAYREMISTVFSDFHLFRQLYGLGDLDDAAVGSLIRSMQLDGKTGFSEGHFTKLSLSTGQRKRLALIVTLLEDRPIYAFDEWAADQDPEFRRFFYEELIQELKRRGKAVLVVTHDDRYFRCADWVATMDYGALRSLGAVKPGGQVEPGSTPDGLKARG